MPYMFRWLNSLGSWVLKILESSRFSLCTLDGITEFTWKDGWIMSNESLFFGGFCRRSVNFFIICGDSLVFEVSRVLLKCCLVIFMINIKFMHN